MITLSLNKISAASQDRSPAVSGPSAQASIAPMAPASVLPKSVPAAAGLPLPALTKAELNGAAKAPSHRRQFGLSWLQLGRTKKRLQTLETVSLGDKRFIALVRVDDRQFLIGGAPSSVGLLTELAQEESFHQVLSDATQGLNVSLETVSAPPVNPELSADAAVMPASETTRTEPLVNAIKVSTETPVASSKATPEASASSSPFDEAFMRAYLEMSTAADASAEPPTKLSPPQSASMDSNPNPPLDSSQPRARSVELPAVDLQPELAPQPQPVQHEEAPGDTAELEMGTTTKHIAAPSFTFQSWPAFAPNSSQKQKQTPSSKAISLQAAAFTWSLTGAAS